MPSPGHELSSSAADAQHRFRAAGNGRPHRRGRSQQGSPEINEQGQGAGLQASRTDRNDVGKDGGDQTHVRP